MDSVTPSAILLMMLPLRNISVLLPASLKVSIGLPDAYSILSILAPSPLLSRAGLFQSSPPNYKVDPIAKKCCVYSLLVTL